MQIIIIIFLFFLGAIVGSFLNVIIYRRGTGRGIGGRSACMSCGHTLSARDLVPIFSYVMSGGRCRYCDTKVSPQYPIVEFLSGLLLLAIVFKFLSLEIYDPIYLILTIVFFCIFLVISVYDTKHFIIPGELSNLATIISLLPLLIHTTSIGVKESILGLLVIAGPIALIHFGTRGKMMGFGDIRLAIPIGLFLGPAGALSALIFSSWVGAITTAPLLFVGKNNVTMKTEIPFGPFLAIGAFLAFMAVGTNFDIGALLFR